MCWTGPISIAMAVLGLAVAGFLAYKRKSKFLWIPIFYFALMELLQAITYYSLNGCSPTNQILTYLSYVHIIFQPFFINAFTLYFVPKDFRKEILPWVYLVCSIAAILMLVKVYPFTWAEACVPGEVLCGEELCSISGDIHLQWGVPFSGFGQGILALGIAWAYVFAGFALPLLYGAWRVTLFHALIGPGLAYSITQNPNEWPAVWCLLSVGYILVVLIPKLRNLLKTKKFYIWKYPKINFRKK